MSVTLKNLAALATCVVLVIATAIRPAQASCAEPVPLEEAIANAETVFVGTVKDLDFDGRVATFDVAEVWKGAVGSDITVVGGPSLAELQAARALGQDVATSVDRSFEFGVSYMVVSYASQDGVLLDNACSNTQPYSVSVDEHRPPGALPPAPTPPSSNWTWAAIAVSALILTTAAYLAVQKLSGSRRSRPHTA